MAELDTLRPEVISALDALYNYRFNNEGFDAACKAIRAELLRLAKIAEDLTFADNAALKRANERAQKAEAELAALKARMKPCARVVGGEVHVFMDSGDEGKYVAVLVVEE